MGSVAMLTKLIRVSWRLYLDFRLYGRLFDVGSVALPSYWVTYIKIPSPLFSAQQAIITHYSSTHVFFFYFNYPWEMFKHY